MEATCCIALQQVFGFAGKLNCKYSMEILDFDMANLWSLLVVVRGLAGASLNCGAVFSPLYPSCFCGSRCYGVYADFSDGYCIPGWLMFCFPMFVCVQE